PRTLDLGYGFLLANGYQLVVRQHIEHITDVTGESSSMGVLDGADVIYVARSAAPHRLMTAALNVGTRLPAVVTSMGRVLLAFTPDRVDEVLSQSVLTAHTANTITDPDALRACIDEVRAQGY